MYLEFKFLFKLLWIFETEQICLLGVLANYTTAQVGRFIWIELENSLHNFRVQHKLYSSYFQDMIGAMTIIKWNNWNFVTIRNLYLYHLCYMHVRIMLSSWENSSKIVQVFRMWTRNLKYCVIKLTEDLFSFWVGLNCIDRQIWNDCQLSCALVLIGDSIFGINQDRILCWGSNDRAEIALSACSELRP